MVPLVKKLVSLVEEADFHVLCMEDIETMGQCGTLTIKKDATDK